MAHTGANLLQRLTQLPSELQSVIYNDISKCNEGEEVLCQLRGVCRHGRIFVNTHIQELTWELPQPLQPSGAEDASGLRQLLSALAALRLPRVETLSIVLDLWGARARVAPAQEAVARALWHHQLGAARLTSLRLDTVCPGNRLLAHELVCTLAAVCRSLRTLAVGGDCSLAPPGGDDGEQAFRALAGLPCLSSLTLPNRRGLQHVGLLAGQLTRLEVRARGEEAGPPLGGEGKQLAAQLAALQSLTRLEELQVWTRGPDGCDRQVYGSLPPSIKLLKVQQRCSGQRLWGGALLWSHLTFEHGRPHELELRVHAGAEATGGPFVDEDDGCCYEVEQVQRRLGLGALQRCYCSPRLVAAGAFEGGHKLRLLRTPDLHIPELEGEPGGLLSHGQVQQLRALLARCEEVRVERVVVHAGASEAALQQWLELLGAPCVRQAPQLGLELRDPFAPDHHPYRAYVLLLQTPFRLLPPAPNAAAAPAPAPYRPPRTVDLLRPLVAKAGDSDRLLVLSPGFDSDDAQEVRKWAQQHPALGVGLSSEARRMVEAFPALVLPYDTAAAAAAALLGAEDLKYKEKEALVLPVADVYDEDTLNWLRAAAAVLERSLADEEGVAPSRVVGAARAWGRMVNRVQCMAFDPDSEEGDEEEEEDDEDEDEEDEEEDPGKHAWRAWRALAREAAAAVAAAARQRAQGGQQL